MAEQEQGMNEYLTVEQAAEYLGVTVGWLYALRMEQRGPISWRQGQRLVYPRIELDRYRTRQRERTTRGDGVNV